MANHLVYYRCGHKVKTYASGELALRVYYLRSLSQTVCPDCDTAIDRPAAFLYFSAEKDECYIFLYYCSRYRQQIKNSRRGYTFCDFSTYMDPGKNCGQIMDTKGYLKKVKPASLILADLKFLIRLGIRNIHANTPPDNLLESLGILYHSATAAN